MTRCQRQKLHWRWAGNPNGRSKFRNLGLFAFTRMQLTLRRQLCGWRRLRGWRRLPEIAQTARCRHQKHRRRWPGSIEIPQIRKFTPTRLINQSIVKFITRYFQVLSVSPVMNLKRGWDSSKITQSVLKNFFLLLRTTPRLTALRTIYFPAITRKTFCFPIRKIISRRPWPPPKNRDIHIVDFLL